MSDEQMGRKRQIMAFNRVSADGYFAAPDGKLDWVVPDDEVEREGASSIPDTGPGTILFGRRTYQMFEAFWPHASEASPDPHNPQRGSRQTNAFAAMINAAEKIVFSKTLKTVTWNNSRIVDEIDPAAVEALKAQPGHDIIIFGSGTVVSRLTEHKLIDEYTFIVGPVFIGKGRTLISDVATRVSLNLLEAKQYGSGNVKLRYAPRR